MTIRQVAVAWQLYNGLQATTVLHFSTATTVISMRVQVAQWLSACASVQRAGTVSTVPQEGKLIDEVTGQQTGAWADNTVLERLGALTTEALPDATQGLVRLNTATINAGRYVRGHIYVPGLTVDALDDGNLAAATAAAINVPSSMRTAGLIVYSRPRPGVPGRTAPVTATQVWSEFSVLRKRRNR